MKIQFIVLFLVGFVSLFTQAGIQADPQKKMAQLTGQDASRLVNMINTDGRFTDSFNIYLFCDSLQLPDDACVYVQSRLGEDINPLAIRRMMSRSDANLRRTSEQAGINIKYQLGTLARRLGLSNINELQVDCRIANSGTACTLTHIR